MGNCGSSDNKKPAAAGAAPSGRPPTSQPPSDEGPRRTDEVTILVGTLVEVFGLVQLPELNGQRGRVVQTQVAADGAIVHQVDLPEPVGWKPVREANLRRADTVLPGASAPSTPPPAQKEDETADADGAASGGPDMSPASPHAAEEGPTTAASPSASPDRALTTDGSPARGESTIPASPQEAAGGGDDGGDGGGGGGKTEGGQAAAEEAAAASAAAARESPLPPSLLAGRAESSILYDGNHYGLEWHTPVAICGGVGRRAQTVTGCKRVHVAADSSCWEAGNIYFAPEHSYPVNRDNGSEMPNKYCPRMDDEVMMIVKPKTIVVKHNDKEARLFATVDDNHITLMAKCASLLEGNFDHHGFRCEATRHLHASVEYTKLANGGVYTLEGLARTVYVYGDRRVHDWPRCAPLSTRGLSLKVPHGADEAYLVGRLAGRLLPARPAGLTGVTLQLFPGGDKLPAALHDHAQLELRLPDKTISVAGRAAEGDAAPTAATSVVVEPGWTAVQVLSKVKSAVGVVGDWLLKDVEEPTWATLQDGKEYTLEDFNGKGLLAVHFDVLGSDPDSYEPCALLRPQVLATRPGYLSHLAMGCAGGSYMVSKDSWLPGDTVEVYYNDSQPDDGFYKAHVLSRQGNTYTVKFETGDVATDVAAASMFETLSLGYRHETGSRVVYLPPKKTITLRCPEKKDLSLEVAAGATLGEVHIAVKRLFDLRYEALIDLKCELTGSLIATHSTFNAGAAMWNAVVDNGVYLVVFREKRIGLQFQCETEKASHVIVKSAHRTADIVEMAKAAGNCGRGGGWTLYRKGDTEEENLTPSFATLSRNATYVVREHTKQIAICIDPRVADVVGTCPREELVVSPETTGGEVWRVAVHLPALRLANIWERLLLPKPSWNAPSVHPTAVCVQHPPHPHFPVHILYPLNTDLCCGYAGSCGDDHRRSVREER